MRWLVAAGLLLWLGATLLLSGVGRLARPGLTDRLAPFAPPGARPSRPVPADSIRALLAPAAVLVGDRVARWFGARESPAARLTRIHSTTDPSTFRTRQVAAATLAVLPGLGLSVAGGPGALDLLLVLGGPLLVFLLLEQRLARASDAWKDGLRREMPVVSEQLAMLLNAGYSIGAAINRLAERGHGRAATDLRVVAGRIRQGVGETAALREWAEVAGVEAVDRLVGVLALDSASTDLGRMVTAEARQVRLDLQRRTVALLDRRAQQVWIPVTVATLVPGTVLLAVPFLAALRLFANA